MEEFEPQKSNQKLWAVACASCGAVVGVMDYFNTASLIHRLADNLQVPLDEIRVSDEGMREAIKKGRELEKRGRS